MIKKKSQKTTAKSPTKSVQKHHEVVVVPQNLPVAVEPPKKKFSIMGTVGWLTIVFAAGFLTGAVVYKTASLYMNAQPRRLPCVSCAKALFRPKAPERVVVEPEPIPENVVALVDNEQITIEQIHDFVNEIPQLKEVPFEQIYPKMLELVINNKLVEMGAQEMGIPQHPDIQKMVRVATDQIITQAYLSLLLDKSITEKDLRDLYAEQVKAFQPKDEIRARHILLGTEEQAQNTLIQLQAGADFASLANQKSLDKNAPDGELGYFTKEMMIPEFAEAVFKMQKGELSQPVQTAFGWHIIQVLDRRKTQPPSFESQKDQLRQAVTERKLPQILYGERLRRNVQVLRPTVNAE